MSITFEYDEAGLMARAARIIAVGDGHEVRPFLPADARAVWDDCDMAAEDWGDGEASALTMLLSLCEVLRSYESPEWGNTGGRYGHSGGFLSAEDWAALEAGDYYYTDRDMVDGDWPTMIGAYQVIQRGSLRAVIQMADILDMAIDFMRTPAA